MLDVPLMFNQTGHGIFNFPPEFIVSKHARSDAKFDATPTVVYVQNSPVRVQMMSADAHILAGYVPAGGGVVGIGTNLGHYWWEYLLPLFSIQSVFGLEGKSPLLLLHDKLHATCNDTADRCQQLSWVKAFFKRDPILLHRYRDSTSLNCFPNIILGGDNCLNQLAHYYTEENYRIPDISADFPDHVRQSLGIAAPPPKAPKITIIIKDGRRTPINNRDLANQLAKAFPDVPVDIIPRMHTLSVEDQIKRLSATTILITPQGAISTMSIFLPPGSTSIIFGLWNTVTNRVFEYDHRHYARFRHLSVVGLIPPGSGLKEGLLGFEPGVCILA